MPDDPSVYVSNYKRRKLELMNRLDSSLTFTGLSANHKGGQVAVVSTIVVIVVVVVSVASGQGKKRREKRVTQVLWQRFVVKMRESWSHLCHR